MRKLVLFNIDGTLVETSKGHVESYSYAFKTVLGIDASLKMIQYHGKTDRQNLREVLLACGVSEDVIDANMEDCVQAMCGYFESVKDTTEVNLLPGVVDTLDALEAAGELLGLVTGNLEKIARMKLAAVDLNRHFKFGGFGSDSVERPPLVEIARRRAEAFGFTEGDQTYLLGDTPSDMIAARRGGAKAIGVATGSYSAEQLEESGAAVVISGFNDETAVARALEMK